MRLVKEYIKRPRRGTRTKQNALFTFHQRFWKARSITHHAIHYSIKQHLHLPWNISPITWSTQNNGIRVLNLSQHTNRIIFRQYTSPFASASHTSHTWLYIKIICSNYFYLSTKLFCFLAHNIKHARDKSSLAWTAVQNQYFHFVDFKN